MIWVVRTSKSWQQRSCLKRNCKGQLLFMSGGLGKFSKSTEQEPQIVRVTGWVEAACAGSYLQHSGVEGREMPQGVAQLLRMLSPLQLLSLSCFALPGALWHLCVLRGLKEGQSLWPKPLPLPHGSTHRRSSSETAMPQHALRDATLTLCFRRVQMSMAWEPAMDPSERQTASSTSPGCTELQRCSGWCQYCWDCLPMRKKRLSY